MHLTQPHIQKLEQFLERVKGETYPEPTSALHTQISQKMLDLFIEKCALQPEAKILDIGCGQGVALELFLQKGFQPIGITLNSVDVEACHQKGYTVYEMDQSFLDFPDQAFDGIWCRHCLEHSIFPYFTLSEFFRVLKPTGALYVEVPAPDTSSRHQSNRNHYSVLGKTMWAELFHRSGFKLVEVADINFQTQLGADTYWAFMQKKSST
jgi:ubiquinone/menaquinone biosynthesis C-methylase UbiE